MAEILWGPGPLVDWAAALPNGDSDAVLLAKQPLTWGSEAVVAKLTDESRVPEERRDDGYVYLLGMEGRGDLLPSIRCKRASDRTVAEFFIHYGITDTWPAWLDDLPSK